MAKKSAHLPQYTYHNRDISWLSFNHRVLLQAVNKELPLYERIKFLAIYHSNLDEFFRVRVAWLKKLSKLPKEERKFFYYDPKKLLEQVFTIVEAHYTKLDDFFYNEIIPELAENNIHLLNEQKLSNEQKEFLIEYSKSNILPFVQPSLLEQGKVLPFLKNRALYLGIELTDKSTKKRRYAFVEVPTAFANRFIQFPNKGKSYEYIILDDAIRFLLPTIFPGYTIDSIHSFMVNRDAELYIEDDYAGNIIESVKNSLSKRESGEPIGFVFDRKMSINMLRYLVQTFNIDPESVIVGSRYLKMSDFIKFPNPNAPQLEIKKWPSLKHRNFEKYDSMFDAIKAKDRLLSVPYQKFDYIEDFLDRAGKDKKVTEIKMSLYRTSERSKMARLLINAARRGKKVTAFVEVLARFDEKSNLNWAEEMRTHGVEVIYSMPEVKVHSKLILVCREESLKTRNYALISTGNFNRNTAKLYCDHAHITARKEIVKEVAKVFEMFETGMKSMPTFNHLMVAPHSMFTKIIELIDFEIKEAKKGKKATIFVKVNSLEDTRIINKFYEASNAGVKIRMIVRGICCLVAGVKGQSENIEVRSIVDRYLEHARILKFNHAGEEKIYFGSADLMTRNLVKRVEVYTPIYEKDVKQQINKVLKIQWKDNQKARYIDKELSDKLVEKKPQEDAVQAQKEIYKYFKSILKSNNLY